MVQQLFYWRIKFVVFSKIDRENSKQENWGWFSVADYLKIIKSIKRKTKLF